MNEELVQNSVMNEKIVKNFVMNHWSGGRCVPDESKDLIFQVVKLNFVYVDMCFPRSAVGLWNSCTPL